MGFFDMFYTYTDYPPVPFLVTVIAFETANKSHKSVCKVSVHVVDNGNVIFSEEQLIKPKTKSWTFTYYNHISEKDVQNAPTFEEYWPTIEPYIKGNVVYFSNYQRSVLHAKCGDLPVNYVDVRDIVCAWYEMDHYSMDDILDKFGCDYGGSKPEMVYDILCALYQRKKGKMKKILSRKNEDDYDYYD